MKSDEEFLAGIYEKAERQRQMAKSMPEELYGLDGHRQGKLSMPGRDVPGRNLLRRNRPLRRLLIPAAACLCVLVGAVFLFGKGSKLPDGEAGGDQPDIYAINPANLDDGGSMQLREVGAVEHRRGTVTGYESLPSGGMALHLSTEGEDLSVVLACEVRPAEGEEVILVLRVIGDTAYLEDEKGVYLSGGDGLFYNVQGSVFEE